MTSHFRLFLEGPDQALALAAGIAVFVLLGALGRVVAGRHAPLEAAPLLGWSIAVAAMLIAHIPFGVRLSVPGWLVLGLGGVALVVFARRGEAPLDGLVSRAAVIALPLLLLAAAHRASEWDEFSHWAGAIRYVFEKDALPGSADPTHGLQLPAYPFAFPFLNALASWLAGRFLEGSGPVFNILLLLSYGAIAVRLCLDGAGRNGDGAATWTMAVFAVAAASVLNPAFVQKIIFTSYADTATGVAVAVAGVIAWRSLGALADGRDAAARGLAWPLGLAGALLVAIKQVNLVIFLLVLGAAVLIALRDPAIGPKRLLRLASAAILPPILVYALWRYHVAAHVGGAGEFGLMPVSQWIVGRVPEILARMATIAAKKGAYFGPMLIVVALGLRALWRCRTPRDRLALIAAAVFVGYNGFLLLTYVAFFGEGEGTRAASFWRYNTHIALLGAAFFAYLAGDLWRRQLGARPLPRAVGPALIVVALALPVVLAPKLRFDLTPPKPHFRAVAQAIVPLVPRQARLIVLDPEGSGESGIMALYHLRRADKGVAWLGAGHAMTADKIAKLFAESPPDFVLVHSGARASAAETGLALDERTSYLLRREAGGWIIAGRWPYPKN